MIRIERHQLGFADRIPPRPPRLMQAEFAEQFDFDTFAYDVFSRCDIGYLISPPNALDEWERALQIIQLDGKPLASRACRLHQGKVDKLIVDGPARSVQWPGHSLALPDLPRSGVGKNILYTLQKDNDPKWIQDWIDWHVRHHRIDAVVIYDNNSQRYPVDVLRQALYLHHWQISTNWKYDRSLAADLGDRSTLRLADPQDVFRRVSPVMFLRWLKDSNMRRLRGWRWRLKRWRG
jgi:hypothetical protein